MTVTIIATVAIIYAVVGLALARRTLIEYGFQVEKGD